MNASEFITDFDKRHGNDFVVSGDDILYPDGASRSRTWPMTREPPHDPADLRKAKRCFWQAKLDLKQQQFDDTKRQLTWRANAGFSISDAEIEALKTLKQDVLAAKQKLDQLAVDQRGYTDRELAEAERLYREQGRAVAALGRAEVALAEATGEGDAGDIDRHRQAVTTARAKLDELNDKWNNTVSLAVKAVLVDARRQQHRVLDQARLMEIEV